MSTNKAESLTNLHRAESLTKTEFGIIIIRAFSLKHFISYRLNRSVNSTLKGEWYIEAKQYKVKAKER